MFLTQKQLEQIGFKHLGKNVLISDKASIYFPQNIRIGDYSRIDDFAVISITGELDIGRYVHIACHTSLIGGGLIEMKDYSGISSRVAVYSSSDDYNGDFMTNPCVPKTITIRVKVDGGIVDAKRTLRNTEHKRVDIGKHTVIGTGSTILPGARLGDGCAVGAMSLVVEGSYGDNAILVGIPARVVGERHNGIYKLEKTLDEYNRTSGRRLEGRSKNT